MRHKILFTLLITFSLTLVLGGNVAGARQAQTEGSGPHDDSSVQAPVGNFTYQGRLTNSAGGSPVAGPCDMEFSLWTDLVAGSQVGATFYAPNQALSDGYFSVEMTFGDAAFQGDARYLQIAVACPSGGGSPATLTPRVTLNGAPYALGLRPGAVISQTSAGPLLSVKNAGAGHGVQGSSYSSDLLHAGVTGSNPGGGAGAGVYGYSLGGYGVYGLSTTRTGIYGTAPVTGLLGIATTVSGAAYGVYGKADSPLGRGVYGEGKYYGLYGVGSDPTDMSVGVYGKTDTTGTGHGVMGYADQTTTGYGGYFRASNSVGLYAYGQGTGPRTVGDIRLGGDWGVIAADDSSASGLSLVSNNAIYLHLDDNNDDAISKFELFDGADHLASVFEVDQNGNLYTAGNLSAGGTKPAVVSTEHYGKRKLYAVESPQVWFEDLGAGALVNGVAIIHIEPTFAETVNLADYHVFLTPLGDCRGLYVAVKTPTYFEVRELGGGASNISFDYRIVAKRLGYEAVRMEEGQR